jgi:ubiquinone/menaquinone biosynthesis C-methylase UbiE
MNEITHGTDSLLFDKERSKVKQYLISQFGHPRGVVGWLVGQIMAYENQERIVWTISQLAIQPEDRLLEIGVGPGLGIEQAAERAKMGFTAGIDHSERMIRQASQRNAHGIREGRIELRQGDVATLPYERDMFDKLFVINSLHHWPDLAKGLIECRRVLKPGGLLAVMEQPHGVQSEAAVRRRGVDLVAQLAAAGFREADFTCESLERGPAVYATGIKVSDKS